MVGTPMSNNFTENTRVQVPAAMHLVRLGYTYLSYIKDEAYNDKTNILTEVFKESLMSLNPSMNSTEAQAHLDELLRVLNNDDLGREFYQKISANSGVKYIDFEHPENNQWHCTTEFTCENKETGDNFRPDITCFINGMPLVFIEVKKPQNHEGMIPEKERIQVRMRNKAFRRFINITQFMIFSNNEEYDTENIVPIQGSFYATTSKGKAFFNTFREADADFLQKCGYNPIVTEEVEKQILIHRNCQPLKSMPEYQHNLRPDSPTNRILTSMLSRERVLFILRYGLAYVERKWEDENQVQHETLEKHIMRYQQLFATLAIRRTLDAGKKSGIIWHTQGSGKTALSYSNVKSLTDYYAKQNITVKFYFVVDRIDLLDQAVSEFSARGLSVRTASSREELMNDFKSNTVINNASGKMEIMVVNIQKFETDSKKVKLDQKYSINLQRVFFIDEAHRGYNPKGCFLANLFEADPASVKIALTGTPLIGEERASWKVFGDYIDKYYYDKSIADGYTLKLMREDIETQYKNDLNDILENLENDVKVKKKDIDHNLIIEHPTYISPILDYIVADLRKFRKRYNCFSVGGMIVCETNAQARKMHEMFEKKFGAVPQSKGYDTSDLYSLKAAENTIPLFPDKPLKSALILHDEGDKSERKMTIEDYKKKEHIDFLIVNHMLLTGFDAPRLKKLYLCRKMDGHDLLQALTRVNRPYLDFKYGYVVDFANIKQNFIETNNMYLRELNRTTEDADSDSEESGAGTALMVSPTEITQKLQEIKSTLFNFTTDDKETFSEEVQDIDDKEVLYELRRTLEEAKAMYNQVRTFGDEELKAKFESINPENLSSLVSEVTHRIERINLLNNNEHKDDVSGIINEALWELQYSFKKRAEEELQVIYNDIIERFHKVRAEFEANFDQKEDEYVLLSEEFKEYFRKRGFTPSDVNEAREEIGYMDSVMKKIREINRRNNMLKKKYKDDEKFVRIHKRLTEENAKREKPIISKIEYEVCNNLLQVKLMIDDRLYYNYHALENEPVFTTDVMRDVSTRLYEMNISASIDDRKFIRNQIVTEYMGRYNELRK